MELRILSRVRQFLKMTRSRSSKVVLSNKTDQAIHDLKGIAGYISKDFRKHIQIQRMRKRTQIHKQYQVAGQKLEIFGDANIR